MAAYGQNARRVAGGRRPILCRRARTRLQPSRTTVSGFLKGILERVWWGEDLGEAEVTALFAAEGSDLSAVLIAADPLREKTVGQAATYVVNRNINYTNMCLYHCGFCTFIKSGMKSSRGAAYRLDLDEIARRTVEARARGAAEVCLQGGVHPSFTGETYLDIVSPVRAAAGDMHGPTFSPLEITHGARTLWLPVESYLGRLKAVGLSTLGGTAAEILEEIRAIICPDKLRTEERLAVMRAAHALGRRSTATIVFGHLSSPAIGHGTSCAFGRCSARRGGLPSSCRSLSCTWEHPCGGRAWHNKARHSAKRYGCTPLRASSCILTSKTFKPRGSKWVWKARLSACRRVRTTSAAHS